MGLAKEKQRPDGGVLLNTNKTVSGTQKVNVGGVQERAARVLCREHLFLCVINLMYWSSAYVYTSTYCAVSSSWLQCTLIDSTSPPPHMLVHSVTGQHGYLKEDSC